MTPTFIRSQYPPHVLEAWEWIEIYCPHYSTIGRDWQTMDNMTEPKELALMHLETLRRANMIEIENAPPRGNFVKHRLDYNQPKYITCPRCRGYDLEKQWCLVCDKTGFILKPQSNN